MNNHAKINYKSTRMYDNDDSRFGGNPPKLRAAYVSVFMRIKVYCKVRNIRENLFSRIALKDIFATLKIRCPK